MTNIAYSTNAEIPGTLEELGKVKFFQLVYQTYWKYLFYHANKMMKDVQSAKDVVQNTFISFWEKIETIKHGSIKRFLYTSLRHMVIDLIRKSKTKSKYTKVLSGILERSDFHISYDQLPRLIRHLEEDIKKLTPKMREIFELSYYHFLSYREIAKKVDTTEANVRKNHSNAVEILKDQARKRMYSIIMLIVLHLGKEKKFSIFFSQTPSLHVLVSEHKPTTKKHKS
jgi:RNA polymerase sigma factor (sigma-70 family)